MVKQVKKKASDWRASIYKLEIVALDEYDSRIALGKHAALERKRLIDRIRARHNRARQQAAKAGRKK